jgi:hydroxymethylglutaryl-CoA reductase
MDERFISGFSKLSKEQKLKIVSEKLADDMGFLTELNSLNHRNPEVQSQIEQFSENTLGNYPLPYGVAPNFLINDEVFTVPMVTEESSVVAAAAAAARFWADRGGFHAKVRGTIKIGQIHFCWNGDKEILLNTREELKEYLLENTEHLIQRMQVRGGGVRDIELIDFTGEPENYYQLRIGFETAESMGANFINSVLEEMASLLKFFYNKSSDTSGSREPVEIIMSILSNYTPGCVVECYVETRQFLKAQKGEI